mmetsp:Transcript_27040/g.68140  ORF Transcript_27040/g.68140 Transcript_27040/m.68140 type:complete len:235 (-) Transcript_27040:10730-11434(-)
MHPEHDEGGEARQRLRRPVPERLRVEQQRERGGPPEREHARDQPHRDVLLAQDRDLEDGQDPGVHEARGAHRDRQQPQEQAARQVRDLLAARLRLENARGQSLGARLLLRGGRSRTTARSVLISVQRLVADQVRHNVDEARELGHAGGENNRLLHDGLRDRARDVLQIVHVDHLGQVGDFRPAHHLSSTRRTTSTSTRSSTTARVEVVAMPHHAPHRARAGALLVQRTGPAGSS